MASVFTAGRILGGLAVVGLLACGGQRCHAKPTPNEQLAAVVHPDLSGLEELVREQLGEARRELGLIEAKTEVGEEELSRAYGKLGKLYHAYELFESAKSCYLNAKLLSSSAFPWAYNLARVYQRLGDPDDQIRDGARALKLMQPLIANPRSVDLEHVETLAMLSAELGQFDKAVGLQRQMVAQARAANLTELARALTGNLEKYEIRRPCRVPWRDDDPVFSPVAGSPAVLGPDAERASLGQK